MEANKIMGIEVSVILPCRNEEHTLEKCIRQIKEVLKKEKISSEIIVSDSSSDRSPEIAKKNKAVLVKHDKKGYGIAIMQGLKKAKGKYIVIGDADGTYDFSQIPLLLNKLKSGYDLVIGTRIKGNIEKGAMPWHHRYIGNPLLSFLLNIFFNTKVSDAHSGFRAIKKTSLKKLNLKTSGMEFASEMIIKAAKQDMKICEVPIKYMPRKGESKLKSFSDGWRHLRFMLMFSPNYLFFIPGALLFLLGFSLMSMLMFGTFIIKGNDAGPFISLAASFITVLGYQVISLGLYSKIYAIHTGFEKQDKLIDFIAEKIPLEKGILIGLSILLSSIFAFFAINKFIINKIVLMIFCLTIIIIGFQTIFSVFFVSIMLVEKSQ